MTLLFFLTAFFLHAAEPDATPAPEHCENAQFNRENIVCLRQGVGSYSLRERLATIERRLTDLAQDRSFAIEEVRVQPNGASVDVRAGSTVLLNLRDGDLYLAPDQSMEDAAKQIADRARQQITLWRKQRSVHDILIGAAYSLVTLIVLFLALTALGKTFRRLRSWIDSGRGRYIRSFKIKSVEILNQDRIARTLDATARGVQLLITLFALYLAVPLTLSFFPWTENLAPKIVGYVTDPLSKVLTVFLDYLPNLFFLVLIVYLTRLVLRLVNFIFGEIARGNLQFDGFYREWAPPTYKLVRVFILAMALIMAFPYLPGSSSPAFQGISVFLGLILSLGSSSAIANVVAGVVLTYMRPFNLGDRVQIADTVGDVIEKTLLVTRIRSIKNVDITVPNSMVLSSHIINFSSAAKETGLILHTEVTIGYDVPWRQVQDLLREAANRTNMIAEKPEPYVLQTALNDFYVNYQLNAHTKHPEKMSLIYSLLHQNIQDSFNEAGVEIMSPHYRANRDGSESTVVPRSPAEA